MWRQSGPSVWCQWQGGTQDVQRSHKVSVSHLCLVTLSLPFLGAADISQYFHLFFQKPLLKLRGNLKYMAEVNPWMLKTRALLYWCVVVAWWFLEWSIDWIYDELKILTTSKNNISNAFYGIFVCPFCLLEPLFCFFSTCFSPQSRSCNRLHLKPLPHSDSVRRLHLSTLGHPECHWTHHFPRTHRLHSLWRPQQAQHGSLYYGWAGTFFFNVRGKVRVQFVNGSVPGRCIFNYSHLKM